MTARVAITGVGTVNAAFAGGAGALGAWLAQPHGVARPTDGFPAPVALLQPSTLEAFIDEVEGRRLSRACQLALAAARLALQDAGLAAGADVGLIVGTEFGDLRSTVDFADGYLAAGPSGLSALLFPNTVMNTMAAATSIAVAARQVSLTLNEATIAGELAVAHAASAVAAGRSDVALAGGVDQFDPLLASRLRELGAPPEIRGEGGTFVVLEPSEAARARGATVLGEIEAAAWRALPARPHGVGRRDDPTAVTAVLARAGVDAAGIGWVYASASGDAARDAWEARLLGRALGTRPGVSLRPWLGQHAGVGALAVAAAAWTARTRRLPAAAASTAPTVVSGAGLVHGVARGGAEVALVVGAGADAA